jgi:hypothetical protein
MEVPFDPSAGVAILAEGLLVAGVAETFSLGCPYLVIF